MLTRSEIVARLRQVAERQTQLELVVLFGSVARDQCWAESDVDVGVLAGPGFDLLSFAEAAERELGLPVDVVDLRGELPIELLKQLVQDGLDVFAASPDVGSSFRAASLWAIETDAPMLDRVARDWLHRVATEGLR